MSMDDIKVFLFDWGVPVLIGLVAYFLRNMAHNLQTMTKDISEIKETVIKHSITMEEIERRVDRLESKVDNL